MIVRARSILAQSERRIAPAACADGGEPSLAAPQSGGPRREPRLGREEPRACAAALALPGELQLLGQVFAQHWRERDERRRAHAAVRAYGLRQRA